MVWLLRIRESTVLYHCAANWARRKENLLICGEQQSSKSSFVILCTAYEIIACHVFAWWHFVGALPLLVRAPCACIICARNSRRNRVKVQVANCHAVGGADVKADWNHAGLGRVPLMYVMCFRVCAGLHLRESGLNRNQFCAYCELLFLFKPQNSLLLFLFKPQTSNLLIWNKPLIFSETSNLFLFLLNIKFFFSFSS